MSKEITEQAKLQRGEIKTFKVEMKILPPNPGHDSEPIIMDIVTDDIETEMIGVQKGFEPFTWDVISYS